MTGTSSILHAPPLADVAALTTAAADHEAQTLAARIAAGDEAAFRTLYDNYAPRIRRLALTLARGDAALADEVAQQTLLTAAAKLRRVDGEAHLWNWLARVARQHLGKVWRRQRREGVPLPLEAGGEIAAEAAGDRTLERALDAVLQALPDDERHLLRRFYEDRSSQQTIAAELATTPKAVANRLDRLRVKLRARVLERLRHEEG